MKWLRNDHGVASAGRSLTRCQSQTGRLEGHYHNPSDVPHPILRLKHPTSVDCPRDIKVDLDIVRGGYIDTLLLRKPMSPCINTAHRLYPRNPIPT